MGTQSSRCLPDAGRSSPVSLTEDPTEATERRGRTALVLGRRVPSPAAGSGPEVRPRFRNSASGGLERTDEGK